VQNEVVAEEDTQDMVFSYLTRDGFRRYSSSNLFSALSSLGAGAKRSDSGGIRIVNRVWGVVL